jgi:hypothetical protein
MLHRRHFLILSTAMLLSACGPPAKVKMPRGTTLILTRHADRSYDVLNETGKARAKALVTALEGIPIDAIYSPGIQRNLDTAAPLAKARGLPVQRIPAENPAARLMQAGKGKTIVWIGNKGNLQSIWEALNAPEPPPLEYGDLYIVKPARLGRPVVERRHYGP